MSEGCSSGLLTLVSYEPCLPALTNRILCGVECVLAFAAMLRLLKEIPAVPLILKFVIISYSLMLVCLMTICGICASGTWVVSGIYVIWLLGHLFFSLGIVFRTSAFMELMGVAISGRVKLNFKGHRVGLFIFTACTAVGILFTWGFGPYWSDDAERIDSIYRIGFIVFGIWAVVAITLLVFFSRFVLNLLASANARQPSSDQTKRLNTLRGVTWGAALSMGPAGCVYVAVGVIPGALRNEMMHTVFWLLIFAMFNLLRFLRQCAEVRKANIALQENGSRLRKTASLMERSKRDKIEGVKLSAMIDPVSHSDIDREDLEKSHADDKSHADVDKSQADADKSQADADKSQAEADKHSADADKRSEGNSGSSFLSPPSATRTLLSPPAASSSPPETSAASSSTSPDTPVHSQGPDVV